MIYQLANGKCIEMSAEQYLKMTDEDFQNLIGYNFGEEFNDPFMHSVLRHGPVKEDIEDELEEDYPEEDFEDLIDISPEEKFLDEDFIDYDNIEQ